SAPSRPAQPRLSQSATKAATNTTSCCALLGTSPATTSTTSPISPVELPKYFGQVRCLRIFNRVYVYGAPATFLRWDVKHLNPLSHFGEDLFVKRNDDDGV